MKEIKLTRGMVALVDDADYPRLSATKWYPVNPGGRKWYAYGRYNDRRLITMHSIILPDAKIIDHIDGNGLNNRRTNLRSCTRSENFANMSAHKDNASGLKGVCFDPERFSWKAQICVDLRHFFLGRFPDKESAARAYDAAAKKHFGEFAHLNFPEPNP